MWLCMYVRSVTYLMSIPVCRNAPTIQGFTPFNHVPCPFLSSLLICLFFRKILTGTYCYREMSEPTHWCIVKILFATVRAQKPSIQRGKDGEPEPVLFLRLDVGSPSGTLHLILSKGSRRGSLMVSSVTLYSPVSERTWTQGNGIRVPFLWQDHNGFTDAFFYLSFSVSGHKLFKFLPQYHLLPRVSRSLSCLALDLKCYHQIMFKCSSGVALSAAL